METYEIRSVMGEVIYSGYYMSLKDCVKSAVKQGISLAYADLWSEDLRNIDFRGVDLEKANLYNADLRDLDLSFANLKGACLKDADIGNTTFYNTKLVGCRF